MPVEAGGRFIAADLTERPGRRGAHQRILVGIVESGGERRDRCRQPAAAEHKCGVAEQSGSPRPPLGRFPQNCGPMHLIAIQPVDKVGCRPFRPSLEFGETAWRGFAVPGADVLADVAAIDPAVKLRRGRIGHHPAMLDRPVTDAAPGVELVRSYERFGRTSVEAARARSAVIGFVRPVVSELDVDEQSAQKREAPETPADEHRVLADPAQAGQPGEVTLQEWSRVDDAPTARPRDLGP